MDANDIKHRRIRCYGHILNLAARGFLYGDNFESFEREAWDNERADDQPDQDNAYWRQRGAIGKLHNIVKFIRASPQRSERFKAIAKEVEAEVEDYRLYETSTAELELV